MAIQCTILPDLLCNFPAIGDTSIRAARKTIDDGFRNLVRANSDLISVVVRPLQLFLNFLEDLFVSTPWIVVLLIMMAIVYAASRNIRITLGTAVSMMLIGAVGLWNDTMVTLAIVTVATLIAILVGLPIGILMARSDRLQSIVNPILDVMQTMPSFVYLIPAIMLFGLGKVPAVLATIIYAVPPLIRLTDLGIRQVDGEVVEAATAFGGSPAQILFGVELPLAIPTIMAGLNQTIMMALSMVVVASMIGARGLGEQVLNGIQTLDVGKGLEAGLGIVILAIVLDRITQGFGRSSQRGLGND